MKGMNRMNSVLIALLAICILTGYGTNFIYSVSASKSVDADNGSSNNDNDKSDNDKGSHDNDKSDNESDDNSNKGSSDNNDKNDESDKESSDGDKSDNQEDKGTSDNGNSESDDETSTSMSNEKVLKKTDDPSVDADNSEINDNHKEHNDPCKYGNTNVCEGSDDGKSCNDDKFDCLSEHKNKDGQYEKCVTGQCPHDDYSPKHNGYEHNYDGHDNHDHGNHQHHNNYCKFHDCHHHNHHHDNHHHTSTSTSGHSDGDVTVKIELKYDEKNSKNLDDMELIIGDIYDKHIDLSDKPDQIKVQHLDIDGGDDFAVCLANEDSQNGDCTVVEADNDHDTVKAYLTVK